MESPKKSLGQHWLSDEKSLEAMLEAAVIGPQDTVLEIGPGLGSLTRRLAEQAGRVVAVERDEALAASLQKNLSHHISSIYKEAPCKLEVVAGDILEFDLTELPPGYKIVANIPYYLTGNLLRIIAESSNPPAAAALLVQKEVAERITAGPGQMSVLAASVQFYFEARAGRVVPAELFTPPPKVDSQIVALKRRPEPLFPDIEPTGLFRIVKAGFSGRRKKLRSSLAAGLGINKQQADSLLAGAGIDGNLRAQELSLNDWHKIYTAFRLQL